MLRASVIWHDESEWGVLCYNEQQRMNKKRENFRNQTAKTSFTTLASWIRTTSLVYHLTKITTIIRLTVLVLLFWLEMNPTSHHPDKCGPNKKKVPPSPRHWYTNKRTSSRSAFLDNSRWRFGSFGNLGAFSFTRWFNRSWKQPADRCRQFFAATTTSGHWIWLRSNQ